MAMQLSYFYGTEGEQFRFYRIPKLLFTDLRFRPISIEAKALYGFLLDRMSLSKRNGWLDSENRVYIYFTQEEAVKLLGCGKDKASRMFRELDGMGLIERHKRGLGRPAMIYVKNFDTPAAGDSLRAEDPEDSREGVCGAEPAIEASGWSWLQNDGCEDSQEAYAADVCHTEPDVWEWVERTTSNSGQDFMAPDVAEYIEPEPVPADPDEDWDRFAPFDADDLPPAPLCYEDWVSSLDREETSEDPKPETRDIFLPSENPGLQTAENPTSRQRETRLPDSGKSAPNNTEYIQTQKNNIEFSETYPIKSNQTIDDMIFRLQDYQQQIKHNIGYEVLLQEYPHDPELIDGVVDLLAESCAVQGDSLRVNRQNVPASVVRSRLLKLNKDHVNYVLDCFSRNTTRIHNIRAYLLSAFYNAPTTMSSYYTAWVNHDLACQAS